MDMFAGPQERGDYSDDEAIQRALISEHAADATYRTILENTSSQRVTEIVREIMKDEQNHQGRLQSLLLELRGGQGSEYEKQFCAGLEQREANES